MSEQEKVEYCPACESSQVIQRSGSGKHPVCMECLADLEKHIDRDRELRPITVDVLDDMFRRFMRVKNQVAILKKEWQL